jgi:cytosine/adenosine deaminase-related metal-dependent hydrolase
MRFLTADYLFPLHKAPIEEGVLQISDKGEVIALFENRNEVSQNKLEVFDGIICPGFVNAHCHLELSHLLGIAEKGNGFLDFVAIVQKRNNFTKEEIQIAIENAEQQMIANGIVGVGDICNTTDTLLQKRKGNLQYYNFIEIFGVYENKIEAIFNDSIDLRNQFRAVKMRATIVPHAPYSVSPKLMKKIAGLIDEKDEVLAIHMQETLAENELFEKKEGVFLNWLNGINASSKIWEKRNRSIDVLAELGHNKILLIHNTFSKKKDITDNYYCTCPKANRYIENSLPDYSIFNSEKLCVGTDSLASNNSLSILEELLVIQENSNFDMNILLKIACKNGAEALGFEQLGSFEKGKIPGANLIQNLDEMKINERSIIKKLD